MTKARGIFTGNAFKSVIFFSLFHAVLLFILFFVTGCQSQFENIASGTSETVLAVPSGDYGDVAWLDKSHIALTYAPKPANWDYQLGVLNLEAEEWKLMPLTTATDCRHTNIGWLQRVVTGTLGFIFECQASGTGRITHTIFQWVRSSEVATPIHAYEAYFYATAFALAPDAKQIFQATTNDKLYQMVNEGPLVLYPANFARARAPSVSVDGRWLAFVGNLETPELTPNPFFAFPQVEAVATTPWEFYLVDLQTQERQQIFSGVKFADVLKWAPQGRWLAFTGEYAQQPGVWILDTETNTLLRVWPRMSNYDWSPMGDQMVILKTETPLENLSSERAAYFPVIIDLPAQIKPSP